MRHIPALQEIMGSKANPDSPAERIYTPVNTLFVEQNDDGTYSVLNDLRLISPEAARIRSSHVRAMIVQFDKTGSRDEDVLRRHLSFIEPCRRTRSLSAFVEAIQRGAIDGISELYVSSNVDPRGYVAISALFPSGQLAKSTFQRLRKSFLAVTKKIEKAKPSEMPPKIQNPTIAAENQLSSTSTDAEIGKDMKSKKKGNKDPGGQGELF